MNDPLAVVERASDGRVVVEGEIDGSNAEDVERRIVAAAGAADRIILDLAGVGYIDSQGMRVLVALADRAARAGGSLVVVAPAEGVAGRVLRLARMDDLLTLVEAPPGDDRRPGGTGQALDA